MKYKVKMAFLKMLSMLWLVISAMIFTPMVILCYVFYGILNAWRWIIEEFIDEELTAAWNDMVEAMNLDELAIDF